MGFSRAVVRGGRCARRRHGADPARGRSAGRAPTSRRALPRDRRRGARRGRRAAFEDVVRTRIFLTRRGRLGGGRARARRGLLGDPPRVDRRRRQRPARPALARRDRGRGRSPRHEADLPATRSPARAPCTAGSVLDHKFGALRPVHARRRGGVHAPRRRDVRPRPAHRHRAPGDHGPRARAADQRRADAVGARDRDAGLPKRRRRPARAAEAPRLRDAGSQGRRASASAPPARTRSASSSASGSRRATATATSSTSSSTSRAAS